MLHQVLTVVFSSLALGAHNLSLNEHRSAPVATRTTTSAYARSSAPLNGHGSGPLNGHAAAPLNGHGTAPLNGHGSAP